MAGRNSRAIDLDDLHSELQRTKEQVEAWSRETVQFGAGLKDQHSKRMSALRGAFEPSTARKPQSAARRSDPLWPARASQAR